MAVALMDLTRAYRCSSSDPKPENPTYHLLYETDTGTWYIWDDTEWTEYYQPPESVAEEVQGG